MRVILRDEGFFRSMAGVFKQRGDITFEIGQKTMSMSSSGHSRLYLTMNDDIFVADGDDLTFTVRASQFVESLDVLERCHLVVEDGLHLVDGGNTISIPLVPTVHSDYEEPEPPVAKVMVSHEVVEAFGVLKGLVCYEIGNGRVSIRRNGGETIDEVEVSDVSFIVAGDVQFRCSNGWTEILPGIKRHVDSMMLVFGRNVLCIQFLLKRYPGSYLELQVPRSLAE